MSHIVVRKRRVSSPGGRVDSGRVAHRCLKGGGIF